MVLMIEYDPSFGDLSTASYIVYYGVDTVLGLPDPRHCQGQHIVTHHRSNTLNMSHQGPRSAQGGILENYHTCIAQ